MPVRHRELGDEIAPSEPKRCRHCDESRSSCGGGSSGPEERASWRVTLDHDLVETLSAIYPEWFKPQHRRERSAAPASPPTPPTPASPRTPATSPSDDTFSSGAEDMAGRQAAGGGEPAGSPPRVSPPKVVVDDSPLQPSMGKHKESLKVKLMMRRPINQLVAQGIMPPLKTPPAYFEQSKQLERAKTGDLLKAKIQRRPDRQELERRHILEQESHVDPSLAEKQRMLKKARLADALNDQLSHRPGPLELIKKNILHTEEDIETAVKSGTLAFRATSEGASGRPEHPSSYCGPPEDLSPSPSPPCLLSPAPSPAPLAVQHAAPGKADKNRKKTKHKQQQPKARFKFHEYKGPPNAHKAPSPPDFTETPYELLLQQQQLLLQLMPASPAPSSASIASDSSEYSAPPPPPPPPPLSLSAAPTRYENMKVSDLRAECKRRNLPVSGPKPQLISRLRPFLFDKEEPPRSPASVASVASVASPDSGLEHEPPAEDIVQSQRRQIEELERKLEASRQQQEAVRREAAGAAASQQGRRLLHARLCVAQLRAQLDALQQPAPPAPAPPAPPRYVLAASAPLSDSVRLFTVAQPAAPADAADKSANYILNGVKVVPIAILPTPYEPPAPPPPPPPPLPLPLHRNEDMDDVIELLVENGEMPPSIAGAPAPLEPEFLGAADAFSPAEVLGDARAPDTLAADRMQQELDDIQNEILNHAVGARCDLDPAADIDADLSVDLLSGDDFHPDFSSNPSHDPDDLFGLLAADAAPAAMDVCEDPPDPERMAVTPLAPDILDHARTGFEDMDDLSLPSFQEDMIQERPCEFDLKEFGIDLGSNMTVDGDAYDYMDRELIPNLFGRGHVPQCDPLLGAVLSRPPPRPARKHYSWDRIEFDAT